MDKSHDISVTNNLIKTTLDSMKGYKEASEDSETANSAFFCEMADERSAVASQLQQHVTSLGGDPEDDSSISGAAHRGFMDLKQAVMGTDEKAIVQEVERGEDYIKNKFQEALQDNDLSDQTRQQLTNCYQSIEQGHARVDAMKSQMS